MKTYSFDDDRFLLILERGEDVLASVTACANEAGLEAASLQGIGAVDRARLGQYDYEKKDYRVIEIDGPLEVVSLIGNVSLRDGTPHAHAHMVVTTQADGRAFGGHLLEGTRCALTMEIEIVRLKGSVLSRTFDPRFNLALLYDVRPVD